MAELEDVEEKRQIQEAFAEIEMGEQARKFIESDLGRCLLGIADQEIESAWQALETVEPTNTRDVTRFQNKAALGRMFKQWLVELINRGEQAMGVLKHEQ